MKDTLNILINNYQKEYEIKPNLLKKTYIDEIKHHTLRGGGRVMDKMVKNLDNDWITQWIHLVNRKDALIYNKQIIEDTYKKLVALNEPEQDVSTQPKKLMYIADFIMLRNSIASLINTMEGPKVPDDMFNKKKIEIVRKANTRKLQTEIDERSAVDTSPSPASTQLSRPQLSRRPRVALATPRVASSPRSRAITS